MGSGFFHDNVDEEDLEVRNEVFWVAMIDHIRQDGFATPPRRVLDVGCHRGGLLAKVAQRWNPDELIGIEPIEQARDRAHFRLAALTRKVVLLHPDEWHRIADGSVDLIVCHEVLFLLPDLDAFTEQLARVLSLNGRAYIVAGCHMENPIWASWRPQLEAMGHHTFNHEPMKLMASAARRQMVPSVRPLRDKGWATHDPTQGTFVFPTVGALLDHQFRHKLLFRLVRV
jgi:SAM-dependent methyltransferase